MKLDVVLGQELADFDRRLLVGKHMVGLGNAAKTDHGIAAEFRVVGGQQYLVGILDDGLGHPDLAVVKVQQ